MTELTIQGYNSGGFLSWVGHAFFPKLVHVRLVDCKQYLKLPALWRLPSLGVLEIIGFEMLIEIDGDFYFDNHDTIIDHLKPWRYSSFKKLPRWPKKTLLGGKFP